MISVTANLNPMDHIIEHFEPYRYPISGLESLMLVIVYGKIGDRHARWVFTNPTTEPHSPSMVTFVWVLQTIGLVLVLHFRELQWFGYGWHVVLSESTRDLRLRRVYTSVHFFLALLKKHNRYVILLPSLKWHAFFPQCLQETHLFLIEAYS